MLNLFQKKRMIHLITLPSGNVDAPPLPLALLASFLEKRNHEVIVSDYNIHCYVEHPELSDYFSTANALSWIEPEQYRVLSESHLDEILSSYAKELSQSKSTVLAFGIHRFNIRPTIDCIKKIKALAPQKTILCGGPSVSEEGELRLFPEGLVDYFIEKDAEVDLFLFLERFFMDPNLLQSMTYTYETDRKRFQFVEHTPVHIDLLPIPNYRHFPLDDYTRNQLYVVSSKGCLNRCLFCNDWTLHPFEKRSSSSLLAEIQSYIDLGYNHFDFTDLSITNNLDNFYSFCTQVNTLTQDIHWVANFSVPDSYTPDLFKVLRKGGCEALRIGIESGSPTILRRMNKCFTHEQAAQVLHDAYLNKIRTTINILVGYSGETEVEFQETLTFLSENKRYISEVNSIHPFYVTPGSVIEQQANRYGIQYPDCEMYSLYWFDDKGNTYQERIERVNRLISHLQSEGIKMDREAVKVYKIDE